MLGRGLSSLIPPKKEDVGEKRETRESYNGLGVNVSRSAKVSNFSVLEIPVQNIRPNPSQPRESFGHEEMEELVNSIREHGILQPLVVSEIGGGAYELIAGERRLRAAKIAGLKAVPVVLRSVRDQEKLELALIENIQRKNLNPIEEAKAYDRLANEFGLKQDDIARQVGKSRPVVANTLRLLKLPQDMQKAVVDSKIFASQARLIAGIDNPKDQRALFQKFMSGSVSVRQSEKEAKNIRRSSNKLSPSDVMTASKEARLREVLGTKVEIRKKGEKGSIVIEFYSDEELNALINKISKP